MRRAIVRIGGTLGCFAASTGVFYLSLRLPLPDKRIYILVLLGTGVLFACLAGDFLEGFLWRCVRRGGKGLVALLGTAILSGVSFYGVLSSLGGYPLVESMLGGSLITSLAICLLATNSYVIGRTFLTRRREIAARRAVAAAALLYGSMLAGVLWYRVYPLTWSVPLTPVHERKYLSLEEYRLLIRDGFPYPTTMTENEDGSVSFQVGPPVVSVPEGYAPYPEDWHDDVIVASTTEALLPDGSLRVLELSGFERADRKRVLDTYPNLKFLIEMEGDFDLWGEHELVLLPWETKVAVPVDTRSTEPLESGSRTCSLRFEFGPPIPGPLQLRLNLLLPEEADFILPNEPGASVHLEKNSVQLLRWMKGYCRVVRRTGPARVTGFDLLARNVTDVQATAVLALALNERVPESLRVDALKTDGSEIKSVGGRRFSCGDHRFILVELTCAADEIEAFRIIERQRITQVRMPVPPVVGFPSENYGLTNLLDMRIPWEVGYHQYIVGYPTPSARGLPLEYMRYTNLLLGDLGSRCDGLVYGARPLPGSRTVSLRESLNRSCPGQWRVEDGKIVISVEPRQTVITVLGRALKPE